MALVIDFYLRDQVIRGALAASQGRPLDLLNNKLDNVIIIGDAYSRSLHVGAEPTRLGETRLHKEHILLVVPHDTQQRRTARIGAWVQKKHALVTVGLGPLVVNGLLHLGQWEAVSLDLIGRGADGRAYLPITEAKITSLYHPAWSVEASSVFVARAPMGYIGLVPGQTAESESVVGRPVGVGER